MRKMHNLRLSTMVAMGLVIALQVSTSAVRADRVPGLYNTGVDDGGVALGDLENDPHYDIVLGPASVPVDDATVADDGFPIPPWAANNAGSRWIGPNAGDANGDPGTYLYQTNFDMTGLDPSNAAVVALWGSDDGSPAVLLNGIAVPTVSQAGFDAGSLRYFGFNSASAAAAGTLFAPGANSLIIQVENGGAALNPTGLRIDQMYAVAAPLGTVKVPGLYNTGVDDNGLPLPDGAEDTHYTLVSAPDGTVGPSTALAAPPAPPWASNTSSSRWIGPNNDASGNGPEGTFVYETSFDLTGLDPATAVISGLWTLDNSGDPIDPLADIRLNGQPVGVTQLASFPTLTRFDISSSLGHAFNPGVNTLTFTVTNAPTSNNPTGLRVEGIVGYASVVPEPGSCLLVVLALAGLVVRRRR